MNSKFSNEGAFLSWQLNIKNILNKVEVSSQKSVLLTKLDETLETLCTSTSHLKKLQKCTLNPANVRLKSK